jgi:CMP-N-acetylneuraminic acid synthetase
LGGLPLLAYRIKTALAISKKENIWCSTDMKFMQKIAKEFGATVPFMRPEDLSTQ